MVLKGKALVPMDAREFYAQIDKADKDLLEICYAFNDLKLKAEDFSSRLEELATEAEKIDSKKEREMFKNVLECYADRLHAISEQCSDLSGELDEAHHCDFVDILVRAEEMAK